MSNITNTKIFSTWQYAGHFDGEDEEGNKGVCTHRVVQWQGDNLEAIVEFFGKDANEFNPHIGQFNNLHFYDNEEFEPIGTYLSYSGGEGYKTFTEKLFNEKYFWIDPEVLPEIVKNNLCRPISFIQKEDKEILNQNQPLKGEN